MSSALGNARYISLESFKRDGTGVRTPVWCAPLGPEIVVFTEGSSFKVKRIRRNPKVRIAKCDVRGKLLGPFEDATCVIVEDKEHEERAYAALRDKYGIQMRVLDFFSGLAGRKSRRAVLAITPSP